MRLHFGPLEFSVLAYHPDDLLTLERKGGYGAMARVRESREGDELVFDSSGDLVAMMVLDPRLRLEARGQVTETLPDGTELVSTDIGNLFKPAEAA